MTWAKTSFPAYIVPTQRECAGRVDEPRPAIQVDDTPKTKKPKKYKNLKAIETPTLGQYWVILLFVSFQQIKYNDPLFGFPPQGVRVDYVSIT